MHERDELRITLLKQNALKTIQREFPGPLKVFKDEKQQTFVRNIDPNDYFMEMISLRTFVDGGSTKDGYYSEKTRRISLEIFQKEASKQKKKHEEERKLRIKERRAQAELKFVKRIRKQV